MHLKLIEEVNSKRGINFRTELCMLFWGIEDGRNNKTQAITFSIFIDFVRNSCFWNYEGQYNSTTSWYPYAAYLLMFQPKRFK